MRNNPDAPDVTGDVLKLVVGITNDSQACEIAFTYMANAHNILSPGIMQTFITDWYATFNAALIAVLPITSLAGFFSVADMNPGETPTQSQGYNSNNGTVIGNAYPSYVSVAIFRSSNLKGQHGRGRVQFPAVPLSFVTPGTNQNRINAGAITLYDTIAGLMSTTITSSGVPWRPIISTTPVAPATVISKGVEIIRCQVESLLGTTRRRRIGRGI
jgi:hypothetical protein